MFFYIKGVRIYHIGKVSAWTRLVVLKSGVTHLLEALIILLFLIFLAVLCLIILYAANAVEIGVSGSIIGTMFFATIITLYSVMGIQRQLSKKRREIREGSRRESYVTYDDYSYQMFFKSIPDIEGLTLDHIDEMFSDRAMVAADRQLRTHTLDNYHGLEVMYGARRTVLRLLQAMYVSNHLFSKEVSEAIQLQHRINDSVTINYAERARAKVQAEQDKLTRLVVSLQAESAHT